MLSNLQNERGGRRWFASEAAAAGRMAGSGSAVFALLPEGKSLAPVPAQWNQEAWTVRECGKMEVHPLVGWAPSDDSVAG